MPAFVPLSRQPPNVALRMVADWAVLRPMSAAAVR